MPLVCINFITENAINLIGCLKFRYGFEQCIRVDYDDLVSQATSRCGHTNNNRYRATAMAIVIATKLLALPHNIRSIHIHIECELSHFYHQLVLFLNASMNMCVCVTRNRWIYIFCEMSSKERNFSDLRIRQR